MLRNSHFTQMFCQRFPASLCLAVLSKSSLANSIGCHGGASRLGKQLSVRGYQGSGFTAWPREGQEVTQTLMAQLDRPL